VSAGAANTALQSEAGAPQIAGSAVVLGTARLGEGSLLAQGAVVRSHGAWVELGTGSAMLENSVVVGERTIIGAGVRIIGDSHGPVRIGNDVQILENTVLHLLPDNDLVLDDGVIVGPGAMIHGCRIGAGSVVEPGAIVCDHSVLGADCVVRAGAVVKQRSRFDAGSDIDGFPAVAVGRLPAPPDVPAWAWQVDDLPDWVTTEH
jgi:carbonic anhydrase/acetyltransferase-like protein (isoleucine patch superfamily)